MGATGIGEMAMPPDGAARELVPFARLDHDELTDLAASVEWLNAPAGLRLFTVGDPSDGMYGVLSGRVRVYALDDGPGGAQRRCRARRHLRRGFRCSSAGPLAHRGGRPRRPARQGDAGRFAELMCSAHVATGVASLYAARFAGRPDPAEAPDHPPAVVVDAAVGRDDCDSCRLHHYIDHDEGRSHRVPRRARSSSWCRDCDGIHGSSPSPPPLDAGSDDKRPRTSRCQRRPMTAISRQPTMRTDRGRGR